MEMSEATAAQMQQALNAMMAQARAQMAQLPPEQRQMMEQRMGGAMGGHVQAEPFTLKHTGRRGSAAGIGCEWVSVYQGASLFSETCVATPAAAGVSDADYRTLHAMFTLLGKMSRRMSSAARGADGSLMAPEIGGIAVLVRDNANGNNQSRLTTVDHSSLGAEQFQVPAGYQKVDPMADMGRL